MYAGHGNWTAGSALDEGFLRPLLPTNQNRRHTTTFLPSIRRSIMFWTLGSIYGATAVAFGAFGAHGLKKKIADPTKIAAWNTAAHYQVRSHHFVTTASRN